MVRLRERSMTRLRAMVKSQVSKRALPLYWAAAEEDAHPGLLEEVFGDFALAGEEEQVAQEAVLIELDEVIEELGVLALQAARDRRIFALGFARRARRRSTWRRCSYRY